MSVLISKLPLAIGEISPSARFHRQVHPVSSHLSESRRCVFPLASSHCKPHRSHGLAAVFPVASCHQQVPQSDKNVESPNRQSFCPQQVPVGNTRKLDKNVMNPSPYHTTAPAACSETENVPTSQRVTLRSGLWSPVATRPKTPKVAARPILLRFLILDRPSSHATSCSLAPIST
jgi:hypothetical protein